ncbi:MAG: ABC transporter ATP-binding protein [Candidatus Omnitrophica bacterium]|nr:ABC transporter ATP-binding protein [Candidatus Omnitrophota bacterium]
MQRKVNLEKNEEVNLATIKDAFRLFLRFNKYILRYWKLELFLLILGNFSIVFTLVTPYLGKIILDEGILAKNIILFIRFAVLTGGIYLLKLAVDNGNSYLKSYVIRKVKIDLSKSVFKKMRRFSLRFFQNRSTGECIFRVNNDISSSANIITNTLSDILLTLFKLVSVTIIILFINWKILILVLVYQFLVIFQIQLFIKKIQELMKKGLKKSQEIFRILNQLFSHIYFIKASGTMTFMVRKYFHALAESIRLELRNTKLGLASRILSNVSNKLFFGIIGFLGALLVIKGQITLGSLSAIMVYLAQGTGAYAALLSSARQIVLNRISLERITELLDAEIDIKEKDKARDITFLKRRIEFKDVCFGYEKGRYVLDKMSFIIPPVAKIALVGPSGCGKTTILNLILRLYDVNEGAVFLDDYDIRDVKFKSIYSQIGIALQQTFLWNDTIAYNILYGAEKAGEKEMIKAAKVAEAHNFILNLAKQYDSIIGEMVYTISEGQKQRVAIARALIKNPKILILDEALPAVDSETEDKIIDNIKQAFKDSTLIIVSHRLSVAKKMDLVYFLESPDKMDIGTHAEFIKTNSRYRELFASQIEEERVGGKVK